MSGEWTLESSKCFLTNSAYRFLDRNAAVDHGFSLEVLVALKQLWLCKVPSHGRIFLIGFLQSLIFLKEVSSRFLRIFTVLFAITALRTQNICLYLVPSHKICGESIWVGGSLRCATSFACCTFYSTPGLFSGRKKKKRGSFIWHALIWSLWLERNAVIFKEEPHDLIKIFDLVI